MEGKELAKEESREFTTIKEQSKVFYEAGIFKDIKSESQAIVKILAGKEMGLTPMQSMMGLFIVNDRICPMVQVVSGLVKRSVKYDYIVEKLEEQECILSFTKDGKEIGKSSFTFKDAAKAGLVNKDNWKNYPRNMLFARAMANGCRWFCPDVFSGHVAEEIQDISIVPEKSVVEVTADGEVKDGE